MNSPKSKWKLAAAAIAILICLFFFVKRDSRAAQKAALDHTDGKTAATDTTIKLPALKDGIVDIGPVTLRRGEVATVSTDPGESLMFTPRLNVPYNWYINGKLISQIPAKDDSRSKGKVYAAHSGDIMSQGVGNPSDGEVEALVFAYVKYRGPEPDPSWKDVAFTAKIVRK